MAKKVLEVTSRQVAGLVLLVGVLVAAFMINLVDGDICSTTSSEDSENGDHDTLYRFTRGATTRPPQNKTSINQQQQNNNNNKNKNNNNNNNKNTTTVGGGGNQYKRSAGCGWFKPRARGKIYQERSHRIAGGFAAELGEFPSYVKLTVSFGGFIQIGCGGTIISEWLVLTAAHCLSSREAGTVREVEISAGSVISGMGQRYKASLWCIPTIAAGLDWVHTDLDIAVLITSQRIQFNEQIQPACLPSQDINSRLQAHVVGFGLTRKSPFEQRPNQLQVLPVVRTGLCPGFTVGRNAVCYISNYGSYSGDACEGDSGGPVYATINGRQSVVAVVSSGINTCRAGQAQAGIYMNVFTLDGKIREMVHSCQVGRRPNGG